MDKIYSRRRLHVPKLYINIFQKNEKNKNYTIKFLRVIIILLVSFFTFNRIINAISPIIDKQCQMQAKTVATKVSNEQASIVMDKYKYDDLCNVTKDNSRKYKYDKC